MTIYLHNTLTKTKEEFKPIEPGKVKIYVCGVTVYDRCHLGHARGAVNFDVLRTFFEFLGFEVTYVKNYTDVDDKIIARANEQNVSIQKLTEQMIDLHDEDMGKLGIRKPDIGPKATEHIVEMIGMVESLIQQGFAYESNGSVFFKVRKFSDYGKLSGKDIDQLSAGIRIEINSEKADPLDFVLWKASKEGEPYWESPWGKGRPGWHIECSAMSKKYLGETFDIHAGGSDLIFPHHENEIAQSVCTHQKPYVNYWLHNGMIQIENQKMSKSLGNFATIADITENYHPEVVRFFLIGTQYRHSLHFTKDGLIQAAESLDRIYSALSAVKNIKPENATQQLSDTLKSDFERFVAALKDDLNTPQAIGILFEITKKLNSSDDQEEKEIIASLLMHLGQVLGILKSPIDTWFKSPRIDRIKETDEITDEEIEQLIQERIQARADKNWARADEIRDLLSEKSIILEDTAGTTKWIRK